MSSVGTRTVYVLAGACALLLWLVGCVGGGRSTQTFFYSLSSLAEQGLGVEGPQQSFKEVVGVGPIVFPDYADRPQMVARTGDNQMQVEEFHRWAGSIKQDFSRVMTDNLALLLGTDSVVAYPWRGEVPVTRRVTVDVVRFDGVPGGATTVVAQWAVIDEENDRVLAMERTRLSQDTSRHGYAGVAKSLSELTARLSRKIADVLRSQDS